MYQGTQHLTELERLEEEILFKVKRLVKIYPKEKPSTELTDKINQVIESLSRISGVSSEKQNAGMRRSPEEKELDRKILEALKKYVGN